MRKFAKALLGAALAAWCCPQAGAEEPDTIKVVGNPSHVVVALQGGTTTVTVVEGDAERFTYTAVSEDTKESPDGDAPEQAEPVDDWTPTLPFLNTDGWKRTRTVGLGGIYGGWLHPFDCDAWLKGGWEAGVARVIGVNYQPWRRGPVFGTGAGVAFRTLLAQDWAHYAKEGDALVGLPYAEGERRDNSRLTTFGFDVPLTISQNIVRDFGVTVGAVVNFNTYASAVTQLSRGGARYKTEYRGLRQRFVTFDLVAMLGWTHDFNVYFRYSPMQPFQDGMGPRMKTLSVGASIGF